MPKRQCDIIPGHRLSSPVHQRVFDTWSLSGTWIRIRGEQRNSWHEIETGKRSNWSSKAILIDYFTNWRRTSRRYFSITFFLLISNDQRTAHKVWVTVLESSPSNTPENINIISCRCRFHVLVSRPLRHWKKWKNWFHCHHLWFRISIIVSSLWPRSGRPESHRVVRCRLENPWNVSCGSFSYWRRSC